MITLDEIGLHHGTDKSSSLHGYLEYYETLLKPFRKKPVTVLEIGVAGGESIKVWQDWFYNPDTRIYGVEIQDRQLPEFDKRTQIFITDATSPNAVYDISRVTGPIDVFVDDGSHRSDQLKAVLSLWWPHIRSGGVFIAEDLHAQFFYPWTDAGEVKFTDSLSPWFDRLHENGMNQCGKPTVGDIEEIIMRKSLLVLKKR